MSERRFRIVWKSKITGKTGNGEYLPESEARAKLAKVEKDFGKKFEHWLEEEPEKQTSA